MMAPLLSFLIEKYGWRGAMLIESAIVFQGCVFALFLRPVTAMTNKKTPLESVKLVRIADEANAVPKLKESSTKTDIDETPISYNKNGKVVIPSQVPETISTTSSKKSSSLILFSDWVFWVFVVSQFLIFFSLNAPLVYQVNRALVDVSVDRMTASILVSIQGATGTAGRLCFGFVANKVGALRFWIFALSMVMVGVATALVTVSNSFIAAAIYAAVAGLGYGKFLSCQLAV